LVRTMHHGVLDKGTHELTWDGKDDHGTSVSSGVYLYNLNGAGQTQSRKMIMMK
jgi:flagellar hook assembly protein FlgD